MCVKQGLDLYKNGRNCSIHIDKLIWIEGLSSFFSTFNSYNPILACKTEEEYDNRSCDNWVEVVYRMSVWVSPRLTGLTD